MLENKKLNMVLSLLIAIVLWAFVIGEVNPETTRAYRDIPIQLINEESLDEKDLAVLAVSDTVLSLTITGTRSDVNQVAAKEIVATVNLEDVSVGENQLRVNIRVPNKVDIETQSLDRVTVVVEEKVAKDVEIQVKYNGTFEAEKEPITVSQSADYVTVVGAATNIDKVSHVNAIVNEGTVQEDETTFDCALIPVNSSNLQVYNVELMQNSITVTAELATTKTVPLNVPIIENEQSNIERQITVPENVVLKGRSVDLEGIDEITAEEIDISKIMENKTVEIKPILPEGVELSAESEKLLAKVQVTRLKTSSIQFTDKNIELTNLGEGLSASTKSANIKVTVVGGTDIVNSLSAENFTLTADLSDLDVGTHMVQIDVSCAVSTVEIEYKPLTVKVVIEKEQKKDGPTDENDDNASDENNQDIENEDNNVENQIDTEETIEE